MVWSSDVRLRTNERDGLLAFIRSVRSQSDSVVDDAPPILLAEKNAVTDGRIAYFTENGAVVTLSARNCGLTSLPESVGQFSHVEILDLIGNQLTSLPQAFENLTRLRALYLDDNQLTALPETIGRLGSLRAIHLDRNRLAALPESVGELANLRELRLLENQLTSLPAALWMLPQLERLYIGDNPLLSIPDDRAAGQHRRVDQPQEARFTLEQAAQSARMAAAA